MLSLPDRTNTLLLIVFTNIYIFSFDYIIPVFVQTYFNLGSYSLTRKF